MTLPQFERHVEIGPIRGRVNLSKDGFPEIGKKHIQIQFLHHPTFQDQNQKWEAFF